MIGMILAHPHLFWLSLGGLLLAAEMLSLIHISEPTRPY